MDEPLDLPALIDQVDSRLLGGRREYTRADVAQRTGLDPDAANNVWRALGFATVEDDERAFTDGDVDALRRLVALKSQLALDDDLVQAMTRMLGRTFSRLASWQGQLVVELFGRSPELMTSQQEVVDNLERLLGEMERLQTFVWRRQLAAYFSRIVTNAAAPEDSAGTTMVVGFADMAQFTAFTRRSSESDLREVLEQFETVSTDVVGDHRGQIVKTIGDEVLFVADTPREGAAIALDLLDAAEATEVLPPLRVGLAYGPVVSRLGDVFGATVNIASRLTSLARPGSILIDEGLFGALTDDPEYALRSLRPTSVRGYHHLRSWRLRRSD